MYPTKDYQKIKLLPVKSKTRISRKDYENPGRAVTSNLEIKLVAKKYENQWRLEVCEMNNMTYVGVYLPFNSQVISHGNGA